MRPSSIKLPSSNVPTAVDDGLVVASADRVEAGDLWRILASRRAWIFGVMGVVMLGAVLYVLFAPSVYTATAQILIDPRNTQILAKDVNSDVLPADGGVIQVESQSKVIESDTVLLRAIESAGLENDPEFGGPSEGVLGKLIASVKALLGTSTPDPIAARNKALRILRAHLAVKRADKVFVIDVSVYAATAAKAAKISDAVVEAYIADQVGSRSDSSLRASAGLSSRLDDLRAGVSEAENRVERYKAAHDLVGTDKILLTDQQLEDSGAKLASARTRTAELRARLDQTEALKRSGADAGAIPEALQSPVISQLRSSAQELQRRESDLRTRVGDRHPDMIAVVEQVREVKRQINAELTRLERGVRTDYDRAQAYEKSLTTLLDKSKQKTLSSSQAAVQLRELNRELDARRSLYQAFLARSVETKAQANIDTFNARILSRAIPPDQPSWPPRPFLILAALGGGLGLGIGLALVLEYFAPTVLSFGQLQRLVGAPVVGLLRPRPRGTRSRWLWRPWSTAPDARIDDAIALALSRLCGPLVMLRGVPEPYSLMLTSALDDGGARAETVDRIVMAAADRGISVLLVEADFSTARSADRGFLDVLRGETSVSAVTRSYGAIGVKRLGLGTTRQGIIDELREQNIARFLEEAGDFFDLIVIDGGAFEHNSRVAPLSAKVDDVVLVAVSGKTLQRDAISITNAVASSSGHAISASMLFQTAL